MSAPIRIGGYMPSPRLDLKMAIRISPILRDWLRADSQPVTAFARKASKLIDEGRFAARGGEAWPASDGVNGRAVQATFGLGIEARWFEERGTIYLQHTDEVAKLIIPYRMALSIEGSLKGYSISQIAPFPFRLTKAYKIIGIYSMQAGLGLALCFKV